MPDALTFFYITFAAIMDISLERRSTHQMATRHNGHSSPFHKVKMQGSSYCHCCALAYGFEMQVYPTEIT